MSLKIIDAERAATQTFTITVNLPNNAPTADTGLHQTVNFGARVTLDGRASVDPEGDALTYQWTQTSGPAIMLNATLSKTTFIAPARISALAFSLTVADRLGSASTSAEVTIQVADLLTTGVPKFISTPKPSATINRPYSYTITVTDADSSDALPITALIKPAWLTLTSISSDTAILSGTPTESHIGRHPIWLQVRDTTGLIDTQQFSIIVEKEGAGNIYLPLLVK